MFLFFSKVLNSAREKMKHTSPKMNALTAIIDAKKGASKWRNYVATKRIRKRHSKFIINNIYKLSL